MQNCTIRFILGIIFFLTRAHSAENGSPFDRVAARGTNWTITSADIDASRAWNRIIFFSGLGGDSNRQESEAYALNALILRQLAMQRATIDDHRKADELYQEFLEQLRKPMRSPLETALPQFRFAQSIPEFRRTLLAFGLKASEFTNICKARCLIDAFVGRVLLTNAISDEEVEQMYFGNHERWHLPDLADISYIGFLRYNPTTGEIFTEKEWESIQKVARRSLTRIRDGDSFDKVAEQLASETSGAVIRGRLQVSRARDSGNKATIPDVEEVAFKLRTNTVSEIIDAPSGQYIIYLHGIVPSHIARLTERWINTSLTDFVRQLLRKQRWDKLVPPFERQLRKMSTVEILDERLSGESEALLHGR